MTIVVLMLPPINDEADMGSARQIEHSPRFHVPSASPFSAPSNTNHNPAAHRCPWINQPIISDMRN